MKTVRDLILRLKLCPEDAPVVLLDGDGNDFLIDEVLCFTKPEPQVWVTFHDPADDLVDDDDEVPGCREGDMCALPEVSGDLTPPRDVCEVLRRGKSKRA